MDNKQRAKLDAYNRITDFNTRYQTILSPIPDYVGEQAKFDAKVKAIKSSAGIQTQPTPTDAETANAIKATLAKTLIKFTGRAATKARILGNTALANQLDYAYSDIYRSPKTTTLQIAANIRKTLNDNLATLTNIVAADIAEVDKAITAYDKVKDAPTEAIQTKKASGTDLLPTQFDVADTALNNMYALVLSYLSDTRPEVVDEFTLAKQILNTGTRKTSITFSIVTEDDNMPILDATVTDLDSGKTYRTEANTGTVHIGTHLAGDFQFAIAAPARISVNFSAEIRQGMSNNFTIKMRKE